MQSVRILTTLANISSPLTSTTKRDSSVYLLRYVILYNGNRFCYSFLTADLLLVRSRISLTDDDTSRSTIDLCKNATASRMSQARTQEKT